MTGSGRGGRARREGEAEVAVVTGRAGSSRSTPSTSAPNATLATWANAAAPTAISSPNASDQEGHAPTATSPSPSPTSCPPDHHPPGRASTQLDVTAPTRHPHNTNAATPAQSGPITLAKRWPHQAGERHPGGGLSDALWGDGPPCSTVTTLQTHMSSGNEALGRPYRAESKFAQAGHGQWSSRNRLSWLGRSLAAADEPDLNRVRSRATRAYRCQRRLKSDPLRRVKIDPPGGVSWPPGYWPLFWRGKGSSFAAG
jgi:hypothetical protein